MASTHVLEITAADPLGERWPQGRAPLAPRWATSLDEGRCAQPVPGPRGTAAPGGWIVGGVL